MGKTVPGKIVPIESEIVPVDMRILKIEMMTLHKQLFARYLIEIFYGNLVNVGSKKNGATCQASSEHLQQKGFTFLCENSLEPEWINVFDWAADCNVGNCISTWIIINFLRPYDITKICIAQRTLTANVILKAVEITIGTNKPIYKLDLINTCLLLEEGIGLDSTSIKLTTKGAETGNVGSNSISAYAYDKDSSKPDERLINIAELELGATCTHSSAFNSYGCTEAISRRYTGEWASQCHGDSCIDQYIEITFAFPAIPKIICHMNRHVFPRDNKKMKMEWSSGHVDILENMERGVVYRCYNYTHEPTIEHSVKVLMKEDYNAGDVGLSYFKVFAKKTDKDIYSIQFITDVVYHLQSNVNMVKFRIKGVSTGQTKDCSSLIITFKNKATKLFSLKLDTLTDNNIENSSIEIFEPELKTIDFIIQKSLINCVEWNDFWFQSQQGLVKFGFGEQYVNVHTKIIMKI
ncbi:DgyrCDS14579 [Dimorphilus gyrociliatus]|uniref:DgyrCDS14579 n=1 Tax=Dimorphilus gyrociliatus TaxID=2664684 RepID=A0A7I8WE30_9ANNE|nr:DgyrCDS14579 [Dimorphilus gyrociliatus]